MGSLAAACSGSMLGYDADAILSHQVRFSSPVFPGETITVDLWRDGKEISPRPG